MSHSLNPDSARPVPQQPATSNSWWRSFTARARSASTSSQGLPTGISSTCLQSFQDDLYSPSMSSSPGSTSAIDNSDNSNTRPRQLSKVSNDDKSTNPIPIDNISNMKTQISSTKSSIPHSYSTPSSLVVPDSSSAPNEKSNPAINSSSSMLLSPPPTHAPSMIQPQRQQIFGLPLEKSIALASVRVTLADAGGSQYTFGRIPIVVAKCCMFLKESATQVHGIFRLSGSAKRIRELEAIFETPPQFGKDLEWTGFNVHDAASILRRYLNRLPEPIIPLKFYYAFRDAIVGNDETTAITTLRSLVRKLPDANRHLLLYILDMLTIFDACADENRMPASNLSAIFQPCLLSHPAYDMSPNEYLLSQQVVVFFIQHNDWFLRDIRESLGSSEHLPASPKEFIPNKPQVTKRDDNTKFTRPVVPRKAILSDTELPDDDVKVIAAYGGNLVSKPARPLTRSSSLRIPSRTSIPTQTSPNPNRSGLEFREQSLSRRERFKRQLKRRSVQIASLLPGGSADENDPNIDRAVVSSLKDQTLKPQLPPVTPTDQRHDAWIVCAPPGASIDSLVEAKHPTDKQTLDYGLGVQLPVQNVPRKPVGEAGIQDFSSRVQEGANDDDDADDEEADEEADYDIYKERRASDWSGSMNLDPNKNNPQQTGCEDFASPSSLSSCDLVDKSTCPGLKGPENASQQQQQQQQQTKPSNDDINIAAAAAAAAMAGKTGDSVDGSNSSLSSSGASMDHTRTGTLSDGSGSTDRASNPVSRPPSSKNRKSKWMTSYRQSVISLSQTPTVWGIFPQKTMEDMEQESCQKRLPSETTCAGE